MAEQRTISLRLEIPTEVLQKKLEEIADDVIAPIKAALSDADIDKLKELFGDDITTVQVGSLHATDAAERLAGAPIVMTTGGGGYASRLWSKATCA